MEQTDSSLGQILKILLIFIGGLVVFVFINWVSDKVKILWKNIFKIERRSE